MRRTIITKPLTESTPLAGQKPLVSPKSLAGFLIFIIALISACSDKEQSQSQPPASAEAPAQPPSSGQSLAPQSIPTIAGYKVQETFNVGDNVYVRSMAVDGNSNTLWIGTSVGVLEVDLATRNMLNTYTRDQGLANEYVFGIFVDSQGTKWFGTNGGGISKLHDGQWQTYFPMHGLADYWVYSFAEQSNGNLWIGTWAGLSVLNPQTQQFTTYLDELVNEWVYGLDVDSKDQVWIGTEGGINRFDGQTWQTWTHKEGLGAPNTQNLPISDNTGLGTRSRHDLSVMEQGLMTYNPNYVFTLIVAQDDSIWAGTWGGGVSHFDGTKWTNYTTDDGLSGNIVYSVAQDKRGHFWFGTNGGLTYYDGASWYTFSKDDGLLDNNIYAIAITDKNEIWVGSKSGVVYIAQQM
ncbi:MAG: two-component regulator propeller domain-containing protein [Gammaproteobacteria bacterium]|jgi:ligand-binding sensor domain-containing protein